MLPNAFLRPVMCFIVLVKWRNHAIFQILKIPLFYIKCYVISNSFGCFLNALVYERFLTQLGLNGSFWSARFFCVILRFFRSVFFLLFVNFVIFLEQTPWSIYLLLFWNRVFTWDWKYTSKIQKQIRTVKSALEISRALFSNPFPKNMFFWETDHVYFQL